MTPFRRHLPALVLGICLIGIAVAAANAQSEITVVADSAFSGQKNMRPPVSFAHDAHNEQAGIYDCTTCHHMYENGRKLPDVDSVGMECSQCHLSDPDSDRIDLIRIYHLQCRNCHLDSKAGPILCAQCHDGPS